jgi:alpha-L-arabinofuranosidase
MMARNYLPQAVRCDVNNSPGLEATATRDAAASALVLQVVNLNDRPITVRIQVDGFNAGKPAQVSELSGPLNAVNTDQRPDAIVPKELPWKPEFKNGWLDRTFASHSFTVIGWQ